jgi:hypothetical protein
MLVAAFCWALETVLFKAVALTESFQPIFVLSIGLFLTTFFPGVVVEKMQFRHVLQKVVAITITGIGTYLLLSA